MSNSLIRRTAAIAAATASIAALSMTSTPAAQAATSNNQTAYNFFVGKGLSPVQAAGIVGNFIQESGSPINPSAMQAGGPGRGIGQWSTGGRWDTISGDNNVAYAAAHGWNRWSLNAQLEFTWYELSVKGYGLSTLRAQTTIDGATRVFEERFEVCGVCQSSQRIADARSVYASYHGGTAPTSPSAPTLPVLQSGSTGSAVRTVQYVLGINPDGIFGAGTKAAVVTFQRSHGLSADGVVGVNTWNALLPVLREGSTGNAVKALQAQLNEAGAGLVVDGAFGAGTNTAVTNYQRSHGLAVDGVAGDNTWASLINH